MRPFSRRDIFDGIGLEVPQVTQIAVSRSKAAGSLHLLMANNPVFLIARE